MAPNDTVTAATREGNDGAHKPDIEIREFRAEDAAQVAALFRDGILSYTSPSDPHYEVVANYVDHSLGDDLADITGHYLQRDEASFFVATANLGGASERVVVGSIGVEKSSDIAGAAELRRVSVKADCRRFGIGRLLMQHVTQWARERGFAKLVLSTAAIQHHARRFYHSLGYTHTKTTVFCEEPHFELVHFEKAII